MITYTLKKHILNWVLAICVFSALTTGTLAWMDNTQHKSNEFTGMIFPEQQMNADLTIIKRVENLPAPEISEEPEEALYREADIEPDAETVNPTETNEADAQQEPEEEQESIQEPDEISDPDKAEAEDTLDEEIVIVTAPEQNTVIQTAKRFEFTVTFEGMEDGPVALTIDGIAVEGAEISGGRLVLELEDGQIAVIKDLPVGARYIVEEKAAYGFIGIAENDAGFVAPGGVTVTYVNHYSGEVPGRLIVKKIVDGEKADFEKDFWFTATINGENTGFELKHGEQREFEILPGATWAVGESDYASEGYSQSSATNYHLEEDGTVVIEYT